MTRPKLRMLQLGAGLTPLRERVTTAKLQTDMEAGAAERARLYSSARWRKARKAFLQEHPLCALCRAAGHVVGAVAVDHRDGHRGDWLARFWDSSRWRALCLPHHNAAAAAELGEWQRAGQSAEDTGVKSRGRSALPPRPLLRNRAATAIKEPTR